MITGGTNLGKSMLGGKVLEELAERSGIECYAGEGNPGGGGMRGRGGMGPEDRGTDGVECCR